METVAAYIDITHAAAPPHRLSYYHWGNPDAQETVLCVHGLTRNGRDFDFLAQRLSSRYHVISVDMPGRGKSQWLPEATLYNYATYIADLQFLLAVLAIPRLHWVGTSMGGILGMMMANAAPGLLQTLTLNDVGCVIPAAGLKRILSYAGVRMQFATLEEAQAALRENCRPFAIPSEMHWQHLFAHSIVKADDGSFRLAYDPAIVSGVAPVGEIADVNLWATWDGVSKVPTLLIRGEQSDILLHDTALQMQSLHPRLGYQQIAGAGHAPSLMDEAQIALIEDWLARN
jgi:pimeloyl-ACP methyl ester carboxylesterase